MSYAKQEVTRKRITRGQILQMLYVCQEAPVMVSTIELSLQPENPQIGTELASQVNYLLDRGYIAVVDTDAATANFLRSVLIRITSQGQDVVEGTIIDDGVLLRYEHR